MRKVHDAADNAENLIVGHRRDSEGPQIIPAHSHRRGQLIYAAEGCVTFKTSEGIFVVPPHRAVWVPPECRHEAYYPHKVAFRGIFVAPELCRGLSEKCIVVQVDALTRELIETASDIDWNYKPDSPDARLMMVLVDRIVALPTTPLQLPDLHDPRLLRVVNLLLSDPADDRPLTHWAAVAGMSDRSFTRWFRSEAKMSFSEWRQQLKLIKSIEALANGESVTAVAAALGYSSPSSFSAMFFKATGMNPSNFFRDTTHRAKLA